MSVPIQFWSILILMLLTFSWSEIFTSTAHLRELVFVEREHLNILSAIVDQYHGKGKARLQKILNNMMVKHNIAEKDGPSHVHNSINAFLIIKRLTRDRNKIIEFMAKNGNNSELTVLFNNLSEISSYIPEEDDFDGAVYSLQNLVDIYKLNLAELVDGKLKGTMRNAIPFTAEDCASVANHITDTFNWYNESIPWFQVTLAKFEVEDEAFQLWKVNKTDIILKLNEAKQQAIIEAEEIELSNSVLETDQAVNELCRGEVVQTLCDVHQLKCYMMKCNDPYCTIVRYKTEELCRNPPIVRYYDVVTETENDFIQKVAFSDLKKAKVGEGNDSDVVSIRVTKTSWLHPKEWIEIDNIVSRVGRLTGLSVITNPPLQVANYGLGGYYMVHNDFLAIGNETSKTWKFGNRIATALIYLTDVEYGGSTVFPHFGISNKPTKGSAIFWYNLHRNGTPDWRTAHCACPVVVGNKWAVNIWIHEEYQEFNRPCSLNRYQ